MAKIKVSKDFITSIAKQENTKFIKNTNKKVNQLFSSALQKLSNQISYVSLDNVVLQPINELLSGAMVDNSSFTYLLGIDNAQLELNTVNKTPFWKNLKERFIFAWQNRKTFRRKRKKKKKKKEELVNVKENFKFDSSKYNIYNLTEDLQDTLIQFLSESSIVYSKENVLQIVGKDDFGSNTVINVYVVSNNNLHFKYYAGKKKGFIDIDLNSRFDEINKKTSIVGDNFIKMIKIFNMLYFNSNRYFPNQIFIESLLCYCPNDLFNGDIYNVFVKIINYISIKQLKNIKSINNPSKSVIQDIVCGTNSNIGFNKMLNTVTDKDL